MTESIDERQLEAARLIEWTLARYVDDESFSDTFMRIWTQLDLLDFDAARDVVHRYVMDYGARLTDLAYAAVITRRKEFTDWVPGLDARYFAGVLRNLLFGEHEYRSFIGARLYNHTERIEGLERRVADLEADR